jgi:hypothetical protein
MKIAATIAALILAVATPAAATPGHAKHRHHFPVTRHFDPPQPFTPTTKYPGTLLGG